jgi:NAD(P)-dependent dehydrogenase (short-subunit alcohol dehydrogenase family)
MRGRMPVAAGFGGQVALVTGGASGIGWATALAFAREGAKVVMADRNERGGAETEHLITTAGGDACAVATDVTHSAEVDALVTRVVATYGRLDCAINNAGVGGGGGRWGETPEEVAGDTRRGGLDCTRWDRRRIGLGRSTSVPRP